MNSFNGLKRGRHGGEDSSRDVQNRLKHCFRNSESGTSTTIDDLDDALLEKILVRLPVKTAHQGKSVSKRWFNLISTPWFVRRFVLHRITKVKTSDDGTLDLPFSFIPGLHGWPIYREKCCLMSSPDMFGPDEFSLTFLPCYKTGIRVVGTSNDLIICRAETSPTVYYLCNPFTRHWVEIPLAPGGEKENNDTYDDSIIGFISDPYYKVFEDHENGNHNVVDIPYSYKIVRVTGLTSSPNSSMKMEIFSSETGEWSKSRDGSCTRSLPVEYYSRKCSGAFVCNGKFHWMCGTHYIFAYDLFNNNNNIVELIDRPEKLVGYTNVHLGVCRGRLRLLKFLTDTWENNIFEVWELEDYNTCKWCKVEDVRSDPANANSDTTKFFSTVKRRQLTDGASAAFHPYDGDIVYLCFPFYIYSCNMRYGTFELVIKGRKAFGSKAIVFSLFQPWFPSPVSSLPSLT